MGKKIKENWQHLVSIIVIVGTVLTGVFYIIDYKFDTLQKDVDAIKKKVQHVKTTAQLEDWHISEHCTITKNGGTP